MANFVVKFCSIHAILLCFINLILGLPEQGLYSQEFSYDKDKKEDTFTNFPYIHVSKSMYKGSEVFLKVDCSDDVSIDMHIGWTMRQTPCAQEYVNIEPNMLESYYEDPKSITAEYDNYVINYTSSGTTKWNCDQELSLQNHDWVTFAAPPQTNEAMDEDEKAIVGNKDEGKESHDSATDAPPLQASKANKDEQSKTDEKKEEVKEASDSKADSNNAKSKKGDEQNSTRKKRNIWDADLTRQKRAQLESSSDNKSAEKNDDDEKKEPNKVDSPSENDDNQLPDKSTLPPDKSQATAKGTAKTAKPVTSVPLDGVYLFVLKVEPYSNSTNFNFKVTIQLKGDYGYLSAIDWPLLPFYGALCIVYAIYAIVWLVISAWQWRDLLRVQFWIGGVIALGLLEKAVFYAEYSNINSRGYSIYGAVVFAELISVLKRTLSRMLVIIVCLGFGIVKPRLGQMLHRVLGVGGLYFVLASIEGCMRAVKPRLDMSSGIMLAVIPLSVVDAGICWWVFSSLVQTMRTLRLRRNVVKLSLYRHFTNALVFCVLASVVFMVWSIKTHRFTECLDDWKELWIDDAFWPLLFTIILLIIMILWRPTANNTRYAFTPLLDQADEESEEPMLNDAFDGMKLRGQGQSPNGNPPRKPYHDDVRDKVEDDLKWVDENIPSSVVDAAIPTFVDSDEEIMTTKFEMSKMD